MENLFNLGRGPIGTAAPRCDTGTDSGVDLGRMTSARSLEASEIRRNACTVEGAKDSEVFGEQNGGKDLHAW